MGGHPEVSIAFGHGETVVNDPVPLGRVGTVFFKGLTETGGITEGLQRAAVNLIRVR